jgi:hypothetical protein
MSLLNSVRKSLRQSRQQLDRIKGLPRPQSQQPIREPSQEPEVIDWSRNPVGYCEHVLGVRLTDKQAEIARSLLDPPYKVLVRAAHNVGKSFLAACLVNWAFDSFHPGIVLTTAPTDRQVKDILWKEIRTLRVTAAVRGKLASGTFLQPKSCRMETTANHFAHGFTARDADRFQGHHSSFVFIVFDEAEGIDPIFWEAAEPMLGGVRYGFLGMYNPTSQSGPTVDAERSGSFTVHTMNCLDHPNIAKDLAGVTDGIISSAIRLSRLVEMMESWSEPADAATPGAVQLAGKWYLPGPVAQARLLGRRPTAGFNAVFPEYLFEEAIKRTLPLTGPLQIGVDPAWFGDDWTAIHVRKGGVSLWHESFNGQDTVRTTDRVESLTLTWGSAFGMNDPRGEVIVAVDAVGIGAGVFDQFRQRRFRRAVAVNTVRVLPEREDYPNLRSALWFGFALECKRGNVALGGLSKDVLADLRRELTAPVYEMDIRGRRLVESKDVTKERIGRSPDNADACLLAYANVGGQSERIMGHVEVP